MDIHEYLKRIHYQGSQAPTLHVLRALHEAHLLSVPFENLSIHYGQPIVLQQEALYEKIVLRHRGGFCFELNGLFAILLRELGFAVTLLSASMAHDAGGFGPEIDHLTLLVHLADDWLADVGNGDSFRRPVKVQEAGEHVEGEHIYRLEHDGPFWILQRYAGAERWKPAYRFTLQPHKLSDFTDRCSYYQTSSESHFTHGRVCSLATSLGRMTLHDRRLITTIHEQKVESLMRSEEEYRAVLAERFGVVV